MAALIFLAILVLMDVAVLLGLTPDTRDPKFSMGPVIAPRTAPTEKTDNVLRPTPS
jgi:hypothetical protein